jgi:hypothetical protein
MVESKWLDGYSYFVSYNSEISFLQEMYQKIVDQDYGSTTADWICSTASSIWITELLILWREFKLGSMQIYGSTMADWICNSACGSVRYGSS